MPVLSILWGLELAPGMVRPEGMKKQLEDLVPWYCPVIDLRVLRGSGLFRVVVSQAGTSNKNQE